MFRYVFLTRVLTNGSLIVELLEGRILELRKYFPDTRAVIFFSKGEPPECDSSVIEFLHLGKWPALLWHVVNPFLLLHWVRGQVGIEALILRRGVLPNPLLALAFSGKRFRLFTEHHTNRLEELASLAHLPAWLFRPLFWLDRVAVDGRLSGKICLTGEIATSEHFPGRTLVLANPIAGGLANNRIQPPFDGIELRVAMPITALYSWHGVDRLLKSTLEWANSNPKLRIVVTLFGVEGQPEYPHARIEIRRVAKVSPPDLRENFVNQHLGISTLGLARAAMEEACPLKSRFFVSSRIPFIYGYIDPDIPPASPVALRVPNDESLVPWTVVKDFLENVSATSNNKEWEDLQRCMSLQNKTRILAEFVGAQSQQRV